MFYTPLDGAPRDIELPRLAASELPAFEATHERHYYNLHLVGSPSWQTLFPITDGDDWSEKRLITRDGPLGLLQLVFMHTLTGQPKDSANEENLKDNEKTAVVLSKMIYPGEIAIAASLDSDSRESQHTIVAPLVGFAVVTAEVELSQRVAVEPVISVPGGENRFGLIEEGYLIHRQLYRTDNLREMLPSSDYSR